MAAPNLSETIELPSLDGSGKMELWPKYWRHIFGYLPRVQFRTTPETVNKLYNGPVNEIGEATIELPTTATLRDFVAVHNGSFLAYFQDTFLRRYQPENKFLPLDHWSLYPGLGSAQPARINRNLINTKDRPTRLSCNFQRISPAPAVLDFATVTTQPWVTSLYNFGLFLEHPAFWQRYAKWKKYYTDTFHINIPAGQIANTYTIYTPGQLVITNLSYTGGAEIQVRLSYTGQTYGAYLTDNFIRVDTIASCFGLGGNIRDGYRWPGAYYIDSGQEMMLEVQSLTGGAPIDQRLTVHGYVVSLNEDDFSG